MPFSRCAVRVRLFSAGSRGKDQLLGKATIDLSEVSWESNRDGLDGGDRGVRYFLEKQPNALYALLRV